MPHGELLHAWRWNSTSGAAPHAVRAWRCALLHLQVRELSDEASIFAVLRLKPLNLFLTLLPMHSFSLGIGSILGFTRKHYVPNGKPGGSVSAEGQKQKSSSKCCPLCPPTDGVIGLPACG